MTPKFTHDCDRCTFLGTHLGYDVYRCAQCTGPTMVARYGNEGSEYTSGSVEVVADSLGRGYSVQGYFAIAICMMMAGEAAFLAMEKTP